MSDNLYIKANEDYVQKAEREMAKSKLPTDVDTFINLFNSGLINSKNDSIKEIVESLTKGYSNIASQKNRIYVKSREEVILEQSGFLINEFSLAAIMKRIATNMKDEEYPENTKLILSSDHPGNIYLEPDVDDMTDSEGSPELYKLKELNLYDGAERFTGSKTAVASNLFFKHLLHDYNVADKTVYMNLVDLLNLSLSPVNQLSTFINQAKQSL